jgi:hypothetical protein
VVPCRGSPGGVPLGGFSSWSPHGVSVGGGLLEGGPLQGGPWRTTCGVPCRGFPGGSSGGVRLELVPCGASRGGNPRSGPLVLSPLKGVR